MKKHICVFATLIALAFTFANTAHAEWVVGGQLGQTSTTIDYKGTGSTDNKSGGSLGIFGQYRSENTPWGVHFSLAGNSAEYDAVNLATNDRIKIEAYSTADVLATLAFGERIDGQVHGFAMFGFSSIDVQGYSVRTPHIVTRDSATGLKIAGGIEFPFANQWVTQVVLERASFGRLDSFVSNLEFSQTAIRLNIGYRF